MSTTSSEKGGVVQNQRILEVLINELLLVQLPSSLWGVHLDSKHKFLAFSSINVGDNYLRTTKSIVLLETANRTLNVDVCLNNMSVQIPYVSNSICNIQELNKLLKEVDAVQLCKYSTDCKENKCYLFSLPLKDVCKQCYKTCNKDVEQELNSIKNTEKWVESHANIKNNHNTLDENTSQIEDMFCILCKKIFASKDQLLAHEKNHLPKNNSQQFECTVCQQTSNSVSSILEHYKENHCHVKFISCTICKRKYVNVEQLRKHVRIHSRLDTFFCDCCNKCFITKQGLKNHFSQQSINKLKHTFICNTCKIKYATKNLLQQHQREHLIHTRIKCRGCNTNFDNQDQATAHKVKCNMKRLKYICRVCKKRFSCISQKVCHMRKIHPLYFNHTDLIINSSPTSSSL